eukprot:TRINITY_DN10290_c0_g1_i2.p2 TRINITY_DN10290_c0_g1~~TRINITY_DN10290_c0_g1_i2.p2  ORF type:complete len:170 (+),score=58.04 TRINITY_DN10290_c0_g1_i2:1534-2043(+)
MTHGQCKFEMNNMPDFHDLSAKDADGNTFEFSKLKGKVTMITNVASLCGETDPHYEALREAYSSHKDKGLEILAFPCNQFAEEEPGSDAEIKEFACGRYQAEYKIMSKVDVNGSNTSPVYKFLKQASGDTSDVKWNFNAYFLVSKDGSTIKRVNGKNAVELLPEVDAML